MIHERLIGRLRIPTRETNRHVALRWQQPAEIGAPQQRDRRYTCEHLAATIIGQPRRFQSAPYDFPACERLVQPLALIFHSRWKQIVLPRSHRGFESL